MLLQFSCFFNATPEMLIEVDLVFDLLALAQMFYKFECLQDPAFSLQGASTFDGQQIINFGLGWGNWIGPHFVDASDDQFIAVNINI